MNKKYIISLLVVLALGAIGISYYFYRAYSNLKGEGITVNNTTSPENEVEALVAAIGQFLELPKDEIPTLATVSDPERLKDQPFFAKAKKGDKVLLYAKAKKAILYDPVARRLVEVAPLNLDNQGSVPTSQP